MNKIQRKQESDHVREDCKGVGGLGGHSWGTEVGTISLLTKYKSCFSPDTVYDQPMSSY